VSPASTNSNVSMREPHRMSDLANYRRELAVLETSGGRIPQIQHNPPTATGSLAQVAPWAMAGNHGGHHNNGTGPSASVSTPGGGLPMSFYNDSSDNLSIVSQLSPGFRPSMSRAGGSGSIVPSQDSPDVAYFGDERRPSLASITTASVSRGGLRKLQGFFGEEFPGRDSSETSLVPTAGKERSRSYSQSRPGRDRNYSNATDHTREASPSSSRPRTPVPAPEVVPFLYQEVDVSFFFPLLVRSLSPRAS
jgi:adenylate cyclase